MKFLGDGLMSLAIPILVLMVIVMRIISSDKLPMLLLTDIAAAAVDGLVLGVWSRF